MAIGIFVKRQANAGIARTATVHHADLWGPREVYQKGEQKPYLIGGKYHWLAEHALETTEWTILNPQPPFYLFTPQQTEYLTEYEAGWKISDIFQPNGDPAPGIVTTQDEFAISWTEDEAIRKVERFLSTSTEAEARQLFRLCSQSQWQYAKAKRELANGQWREETAEILYRPFDKRWTIFNHNVAVHRRERVMHHMLAGKNLAIITSRLTKGETFRHVQVTRNIVEVICMSPNTSNNGFVFPLYLYPDPSKKGLFDTDEKIDAPGGRHPNLSLTFIKDASNKLSLQFTPDGKDDLQQTFGPEDIFNYIYAVFHSPTYRERYAEFLKIDFPRLPLTSNCDLFRTLCKLGGRLVLLHLMEQFGSTMPTYPIDGNHLVEKVEYVAPPDQPKQGRIYINKTQYFDGIPLEVWEFHIGGYQVCQKWLKVRRGRTLTYDDIQHYQRIVAALAETIQLMSEIDEAIEEHGGWPIK